jgi:hypothetical protein
VQQNAQSKEALSVRQDSEIPQKVKMVDQRRGHNHVTIADILDALRSVRVDLAAYEAEQAGEDFEPGSIEISEAEANIIAWRRKRHG